MTVSVYWLLGAFIAGGMCGFVAMALMGMAAKETGAIVERLPSGVTVYTDESGAKQFWTEGRR